jgi:late competence protein required for DNA uptake (superfamily II DNA/RNA helicase)
MIGVGPFDGIKESSAYDLAKNDFMVESPYFHRLVAGLCKKYKGDGTLVLVDREPLGFSLIEALQNLGMTANFIYGKTPKRRRDELIRQFEDRKFDVLIGGKIVNRGLDLKGGCENLIIATGGKLQSEFEQKIGRAVRHNKRGHSRVFDFFFRCNKYLYAHSKARLNIMVNLQYNTSIVFPNGSICGQQFIQSRYRIPKGIL